MFYLVYKVTNTINGMIYIGVHQTKNINDNYMGSGKLLKKAQKHYGMGAFEKEIIKVCNSSEEMWEIEAAIVNEQFVRSKTNYNIRTGGRIGPPNIRDTDYHQSGEHSKNIKDAQKMASMYHKNAKLKRISNYKKDPSRCANCKEALSYEKRKNKYCSNSCSAKISNGKRYVSEEHKTKVSESLKKYYS